MVTEKEGTNLHERQEMHPLVLGLFQQGADPSSIAAEYGNEGQYEAAVRNARSYLPHQAKRVEMPEHGGGEARDTCDRLELYMCMSGSIPRARKE